MCCKWIICFGTVFAAVAGLEVEVGKPVTLPCHINVENNVDVVSKEIMWKTQDQLVLSFVNGVPKPGHGFEGRLQMPQKNIEKGNLSLNITRTVMCDFVEYECYYNKQYQRSSQLQITATIPKEIVVIVGQPALIPCYSRKCIRNTNTDEISFKWLKDNQTVFEMLRNTPTTKGRAEVSADDIKDGNLSLFFATTYFSDRGTYQCSEQKETTVLKLKGHEEERIVSIMDPLYLHLYTYDPVDVYFQKDNYSILLCEQYSCSQNWQYINRTQRIELDVVLRKHLGTYIVKDKVTKKQIYTYILRSPSLYESSTGQENISKYLIAGFCLFLMCVFVCIMCFFRRQIFALFQPHICNKKLPDPEGQNKSLL